MENIHGFLLDEPVVRLAFEKAWRDSRPDESGGHKEGGFIVQDPNGELSVVRWPSGNQDTIAMPSYTNCKIGKNDIVATFHTHPNIGSDYLQEPSETDKRSVRDDLDLKGDFYEGEFVISHDTIYLIMPDGRVTSVVSTQEIIGSTP